jgi:hypothetical protein
MKTIVIVIVTLFAVYNILVSFGVFEFSARPSKTVNEIESKRKLNKKRKTESQILGLYSSSVDLFRGIFMSDLTYQNHLYYIQRLELRTKTLDRLLTPEEVRGQRVLPFLLSILVIPLALFFPVLILIPVATLINLATYQTMYKAKISDEDTIIDNYFIDLYLLLYSKLRQGSRARLQGTVENYISTLETTKSTEESKVMLKFARYFLNLLSLYEDHVAVPHLRDNYHCATIINFCNIATQSLNGVDNFDNLITYKMQLTERRTNLMRERQKKILAKGERSILAIWIILFIFIGVGWYSKLPTGFF